MSTALVLVDLQRDFFPGGALPVPEGDAIVEPVNRLIEMFQQEGLPMFATRDWHPADHCSFEARGGPWPAHCIRDTIGATLHPRVHLPADVPVISKATGRDRDAYSGFESTDLAERLRAAHARRLVVCGLATDICVKNTVLDARARDFAVQVVREATRGVDAAPGDSRRALEEMKAAGAQAVTLQDVQL